MEKLNITSYTAKEILEEVWKKNDYGIKLNGKDTKIVEYLNVLFYTYKLNVESGNNTYALVEIKDENSITSQEAEYSEKTAQVKFLIREERIDFLENYVQALRNKYLGKKEKFVNNSITAYLNFSALHYDEQPKSAGIGRAITCSFILKITYSTNVLTGGQKVWLLDGEPLPYISEGIDVDISGNTNNIFGAKFTQTIPTKQSKYFRFSLPYITNNSVCNKLIKNIMDGDISKIYTLTYYDNVSFTLSQPFVTKVTLFRTAKSAGQVTTNTDFDIWFAEANDESKSPTLYEMALIDNQFDDGSINVRWFPNRREQEAWYADKIAVGAPYSAIKAPNLNSLTITQQVYFVPENASHDLNDMLTKNYAIIRATDRASGALQQYYYYFIQSASVGSNNQILVDLKMDTIQTYYFDPNIQIPDCIINRAHLNRWKTDSNGRIIIDSEGRISFNGGLNSPFIEREPVNNLSKYIYQNISLNFSFDKGNSSIGEWIANNVAGWIYLYVKAQDFSFSGVTSGNAITKTPVFNYQIDNYKISPDSRTLPYGVFAFPIYKKATANENYIWIKTGASKEYRWNLDSLVMFKNKNAGDSYTLTYKYSILPPFALGNYFGKGYIGSDGSLYINVDLSEDGETMLLENLNFYKTDGAYAMCSVFRQKLNDVLPSQKMSLDTKFKKEFVKSSNEVSLNPKMLSTDFKTMSLSNGTSEYEYNILKLNSDYVTMGYQEVLSPDITKSYARVINAEYTSPYIFSNTLVGLVGAQDNGVPYSIDKYSEFLAQNKNFFLQRNVNTVSEAFSTLIGATNSVNNLDSMAGTLASSGLSQATKFINSEMTLDNMKNSPESFINANGNPFFLLATDNLAYHIRFSKAVQFEEEKANSYMHQNGYAFNKIGKIKNSMDNIRVAFNFIQAQIENIEGVSLSNEARNNLRQRFAAGIRFWKGDDINYNIINYENLLII